MRFGLAPRVSAADEPTSGCFCRHQRACIRARAPWATLQPSTHTTPHITHPLTRSETIFKRAEAYLKEYASAEKQLVSERRAARAAGDYFVDPQAKLAFVVRIRGINGVSPKVRKILQLLRLRQIFNGAFVKLNRATLQMLQLIKPYIAWG